MGIYLKNADELDRMHRAGQILCEVLDTVESMVTNGVTTEDLDALAETLLRERGAIAAFKGYEGFPSVLCTSVNEAVVHGIPSEDVVLSDGDVVSIDCGLVLDGFYADSARTIAVGSVDAGVKRLLEVTRGALERGISKCKSGGRLGNIGAAIQRAVESEGMSIVRDYSGHGIGRSLHEEPRVPNYGKVGRGMRLVPGLVLAIEPMVSLGEDDCELLEDDWTVVTADRSMSAHFEHTVAITSKGPWVLTQRA
jgi:methionyl aminopeptidase